MDEDVERVRRQLDPRFLSSQAGLQKQDEISVQGGRHAHFYDKYLKIAEDYDEQFLKKNNEDLNTTLIFVSFPSGLDGHGLTRPPGGSVFYCFLRLHHRHQLSAPF